MPPEGDEEIVHEIVALQQAVRERIRVLDGDLSALEDASGAIMPLCAAWQAAATSSSGSPGALRNPPQTESAEERARQQQLLQLQQQQLRDDVDKVLGLLYPHARAAAAIFVKEHSLAGRA